MVFWSTIITLLVVGLILYRVFYPKWYSIYMHTRYKAAYDSVVIRTVTKQLGGEPTYQVGYLSAFTGTFDIHFETEDELEAQKDYYCRRNQHLNDAKRFKDFEATEPWSEEYLLERIGEEQEEPPGWITPLLAAKALDNYEDDGDVEVTEVSLDFYYENSGGIRSFLQFTLDFLESVVDESELEEAIKDRVRVHLLRASNGLGQVLEDTEEEEEEGDERQEITQLSKATLMEAGYPAELLVPRGGTEEEEGDDLEYPISPADLLAFILEERPKTLEEIQEDVKPMTEQVVRDGLELLINAGLISSAGGKFHLVDYDYEGTIS